MAVSQAEHHPRSIRLSVHHVEDAVAVEVTDGHAHGRAGEAAGEVFDAAEAFEVFDGLEGTIGLAGGGVGAGHFFTDLDGESLGGKDAAPASRAAGVPWFNRLCGVAGPVVGLDRWGVCGV